MGQPGRIYSRAPGKRQGSRCRNRSIFGPKGVAASENLWVRRLEPRENLLDPSSYGNSAKTSLGRGATLFASKLDYAPS